MPPDFEIFDVLRRHGVPFVVIGGHAVNFHGFRRVTEDVDIVWYRSPESEDALFRALTEMDGRYIGTEIDPATGIERTTPVTLPWIRSTRLMMLCTRYGFLDLFDYVPGLPQEDAEQLRASAVVTNGLSFVSLEWLCRMKQASGRPKDLLDLQNLME